MADYKDLLRKRRAIRKFEDREVPLDVIIEIINDSCLAPSAGNGQPWKFIIVNRRDWMKKLSDESKRNFLANLEESQSSPVKKYEAVLRNENFNVFYNAPCVVFIGGPKDIPTLEIDCTLAASYFMFAAVERGLGTCWVALGSFIRDAEVGSRIRMPKDFRIIAPIILGYPAVAPQVPDRKKPEILKIIG